MCNLVNDMSEKPILKDEIKLEDAPTENFSSNENQEFNLSKEETKQLEKNLSNMNIKTKDKLFFRSAYRLHKKLEDNNFIIPFEEMEKE